MNAPYRVTCPSGCTGTVIARVTLLHDDGQPRYLVQLDGEAGVAHPNYVYRADELTAID